MLSAIGLDRSPSNIALFIFVKISFFSFAADLLAMSFQYGNILFTLPSIFLTNSIALLASDIVAAFSAIFSSNIFCGFAPLARNAENVLLKNLLNTELLNSIFLPIVAASLIPLRAPYTNGVTKRDSPPNLSLFNNFLPASCLLSASSSLSSSVGSPNKSPNVPMFSTSATNVSPAAPPATPAANLLNLAFLFSS